MGGLIYELLNMCSDACFDRKSAEEIIGNLELNQEITNPEYPLLRTSFLSVAADNANIEMVRLLLKHGADPNFILYADEPRMRENPFWDLQYCVLDGTAEENETRLQIAQLMLEYGADPTIVLEDEDLLSYVVFEVFNGNIGTDDWRYRSRFLILLIAYGGANSYCTPKILLPFDKYNMAQYRFLCDWADDGRHLIGAIVDTKNHKVIADV